MDIQHILVASDLSDLCCGAYPWAAALGQAWGASVTVLHADELASTRFADLDGFSRYRDQIQGKLHDRLAEVEGVFQRLGQEVDVHVLPGSARSVVDAYVHEVPTDVVVMARPVAMGLVDRFLGSTTTGVLRLSDVPVLVVPVKEGGADGAGGPDEVPRVYRVLATSDFSRQSTLGVRAAAQLARHFDAVLEVVHAVDTAVLSPTFARGIRVSAPHDELEALLDRDRVLLERQLAEAEEEAICTVLAGRGAARTIARAAIEGESDLIVIPSTGKGALSRLMMGSTSERVVATSEVPVLVMPPRSLERWEQPTTRGGTPVNSSE